jgi:hypothetical protein
MGIEGNQQIIKSEQGRLDKIDKKVDKKVAIDGKDYADIVLRKVDATTNKIGTDFGIKNEAILKDKGYQEMKMKALNGIVLALFQIDEKNISDLSSKLDKALTTIEQSGEKMLALDTSLTSGDKLAQQLNALKEKGDIDGMVKATKEYMAANEQALDDAQKVDLLNQLNTQLLAQAEQVRKGEVMNVKGVEWRLGDTLVATRINMDGTTIRREVRPLAKIEKIDTKEGVTVTENASTRLIPLADFGKYMDDALAAQNKNEKDPFTLGNDRRIVAKESPSDSLAKEAQEAQQKAALIALKDLVVKGSALASCKDFTPKSPRTFGLMKEGSVAINANTGALNFTKTFDTYSIEDQQIVVDEFVQFLKEKGAGQKIEDAKSPEEKLFYQAELSLQKGQIGSARADCIKFIQSLNGKELTSELTPLKEKAEGYLKGMWQHSMNELKQANETMFGKAAITQVRDKMKYGMLKGDAQQMKRFEQAFQTVHGQANERIEASSQNSKTENILQDPSSIFKDLPQATGENSEEISACQNAWQKIAFAQTMAMRNDSSAQKQEHYADAAEALRALGLYDFSEDFVKKGLRDRLDLTKNSDALKAKKMECVMRLNSHREEYSTKVKQQFLEQTRNQPGRPELSEQQFNKLIDQAIDHAADQQIDALILKSTVTQMDEGGLQGPDDRLAKIYKTIENPNEDILTFSDKEISALGDRVIHFAVEMAVQAALMAVSGGIGNIAAAGMRTAMMTTGAREAIAGAAGFMANAAAFELASKTLAPLTGGPGFTTEEDFALDYGKSLLMFGALHGLGKLSNAATKAAGGAEALNLAQKSTIYVTQLGAEVSVLSGLSMLEAARDGKLGPVSGVHLLGENVATVLGLRIGTKIVHATGAIEAMEKVAEKTAQGAETGVNKAKKAGSNFAEGFNNAAKEQRAMEESGQVAYSGVPMAQPIFEGLKSAAKGLLEPAPTEPAKTKIPDKVSEALEPTPTEPAKPKPTIDNMTGFVEVSKIEGGTVRGGGKGGTAAEHLATPIEAAKPHRESQDAVDAYVKLGNSRPVIIRAEINVALHQLQQGETPTTALGKEIAKLKQRDPVGYEHLEKSSLPDLIRTSCFEAILYGQRETMQDLNGKTITIYKGNDIGSGGMGVVAHVAYAVEGGKQLQFGAIKRPHPAEVGNFRQEVTGAQTVNEWNSPNIIKALHIGNDQIIYETSEQAHSMRDAHKTSKPSEYMDMLLEVGEGLTEFSKRELFHGDLKELNVLRLKTGVDAQGQPIFKTVIIDNSPMQFQRSLESRPGTAHYMFTSPEYLKGQQELQNQGLDGSQIAHHFGRATDVRAYGQMIEHAVGKIIPTMANDPVIKQLIANCKDPITAGMPGMLQKTIDALKIISNELHNNTSPEAVRNAQISDRIQQLIVEPTAPSTKKHQAAADPAFDSNAPSVIIPFVPYRQQN